MKKFITENKELFIWLITISIIIPFVFLFDCPFIPGIIPTEIGQTIVGYTGSIIGGFLTVYGVWWTIKNQETNRRKDLATQYKPSLITEHIKIDEKQTGMYLYITDDVDYDPKQTNDSRKGFTKLAQGLQIVNVGRGDAFYKASITSDEGIYIKSSSESELLSMDYLLRKEYPIVFYLRLANTLIEKQIPIFTITLIITYTDEFRVHKYKHSAQFEFKHIASGYILNSYTFNDLND